MMNAINKTKVSRAFFSGMLTFLVLVLLQGCGPSDVKKESQGPISTEDFDFAVNDLVTNYSGFQFKVNEENREEYEALKEKLRNQIMNGTVPEYDAVAMLFGFFRDNHLATSGEGHEKYRKKSVKFSENKYWPMPLASKVSSKTFLIRYPTCMDNVLGIDWTNESVQKFLDSGCENLILDIRGNGGGQDYVYQPYLRLLYDHPGNGDGILFYDTETNRKQMEIYFPGMYEETPLSKEEGPSNQMVYFGDFPIVFNMESSPLPKKAVIIIDKGVGSSGEQLILDARSCSDRVIVYGRDNTKGCLDFSSCRTGQLPKSGGVYQMPMTVSTRVLDGRGIDDQGIAPDVRVNWRPPRKLTDNIDSWVKRIAKEREE